MGQLVSGRYFTHINQTVQQDKIIHNVKRNMEVWSRELIQYSIKQHHSIKVLLVEDDTLSQCVTKMMLEKFKCDIDVANTGQLALDFVKNKRYDLIFMDIGLTDINGFKVVEKMRKHIPKTQTPLIALTAYTIKNYEKRPYKVGMDNYYRKPILYSNFKKILYEFFFKTNGR